MSNTARRTSVTYPNGRVVELGYGSSDSIDDLFSLVKSSAISGESGNKVEYSRGGLARFVKVSYPQPGVEMSMIRPGGGSMGDSGDPYDGYDRFSRVQEMRWQNSSTGTPIDAWQWGYNEASNRTWKKNLVAASGQDEAYGYDGLYQVIRDAVGTLNTNRTAIGGVPGEEETFTYDPTGNWLGYRKDTNGTIALNQSRANNLDNQLTQINGSNALLSYDRAGNATKVPPGNGGDWTKYYQPVWDAWGRIVEVKNESGTSVQKNAYDGLTRRVTKEASSVVTHTYWSDQWKPLEERTGSSTSASRSYLWGERPGHRDELILRDRDTDGNGSLDERLYATMDYFNGTAVLNTSGVVLERYAYSAFGVRRIMAADFSPRSISSFAWDFGFQGQFLDSETGWYNYGYRFYVPLLGRWINRDPIGEDGGVNLNAYGGNDPLGSVDYFGLVTTCTSSANSYKSALGWAEHDRKFHTSPPSTGGGVAITEIDVTWRADIDLVCVCVCTGFFGGTSTTRKSTSGVREFKDRVSGSWLGIDPSKSTGTAMPNMPNMGKLVKIPMKFLAGKSKPPNLMMDPNEVADMESTIQGHAPESLTDGYWLGDHPCKKFE